MVRLILEEPFCRTRIFLVLSDADHLPVQWISRDAGAVIAVSRMGFTTRFVRVDSAGWWGSASSIFPSSSIQPFSPALPPVPAGNWRATTS